MIISGVIGAAMEVGGAVMLVLGILGHEPSADVALGDGRLTLGAAGGPAGVTYDLRF